MPTTFKLSQILAYIYDSLNVKEHIIDTNRDNQSADEHLAFALKMPQGRSERNYIILDNELELGQVFNYLFYLFDEQAQKERREDPRRQPSIDLIFMKKRNHELPIDDKGNPKPIASQSGVTPQ